MSLRETLRPGLFSSHGIPKNFSKCGRYNSGTETGERNQSNQPEEQDGTHQPNQPTDANQTHISLPAFCKGLVLHTCAKHACSPRQTENLSTFRVLKGNMFCITRMRTRPTLISFALKATEYFLAGHGGLKKILGSTAGRISRLELGRGRNLRLGATEWKKSPV